LSNPLQGALTGILVVAVSAAVVTAYHSVYGFKVAGSPTVVTVVPQGSALDNFGPNLHAVYQGPECPGGDLFLPGAKTTDMKGFPYGPASSDQAANQSTQAWLKAHNASDANNSYRRFEFTASGVNVVIRNVSVRVLKRTPAPTGSHLYLSGGCGAGPPTVFLNVDLDAVTPHAQLSMPTDQGGWAPINRFEFTLNQQNPTLIVDVAGTTSHHDVQWELLVDYSINGRDQPPAVLGAGHNLAFHTTATTARPQMTLDYIWGDQHSWQPGRTPDPPGQ
jgi:hypothetical protein